MKIYQLVEVGKTPTANYVIMSQGKSLAIGQVVILQWILDPGVPLHGNNIATIKAVERHVNNLATNVQVSAIF